MANEVLGSFSFLTPGERGDLLWLARESIRAALHAKNAPALGTLTEALQTPAAAFVSLHHGDRLRGCIGTLTADTSLHDTVVRVAVSAALDDPRFPPVAWLELRTIAIEISRLGPLVRARPEDVRPGYHGVAVSRGEQRGVFLPQVAPTHNWDRETLLREVCRKALLPPEAWREPDCELQVFVAEVFGERALTG
jgi:AmmeMemoRadiSam system protein A